MSGDRGDPTLLAVLYDGLAEIKRAVGELQQSHNALALSVEKQLGEMKQNYTTDAEHAELARRVERNEEALQDLKRMAWALGIVGGIVIAAITTVISNKASNLFDTPRPATAVIKQPTKEE